VPILGTSPDAIDLAEDRDRFKRCCSTSSVKQPKNGIAYSVEQARAGGRRSRLSAGGAPVLRARRPRHGDRPRRKPARRLSARHLPELVPGVKARYPNDKTGQINTVLGKNPLLFDRYLSDAIEVDVDCLATARTRSSSASWSTSRRPASIPATRLLAAAAFARRRR
jgi:carbamoyl-phosphate synthase large subunit